MAGRGKSDRTAEGVTVIINMMVDGEWRSATSPKLIADRFGVGVDTAYRWAAEASRHITRAIGDPADIRARWVAQLEAVHGAAREAGELGHSIAAIGTAARVTGIDKQGASNVAVQVNIMDTPDGKRLLTSLRKHVAPLPGGVEALELVASDLELDEP